jgi:hypothetical protein
MDANIGNNLLFLRSKEGNRCSCWPTGFLRQTGNHHGTGQDGRRHDEMGVGAMEGLAWGGGLHNDELS